MRIKKAYWLIPLCIAFFSASIFAKRFRNAYVSFELPPNWNCNVEGTEWVCISQFSKRAKEAIIILTAKEVGPTDSFQAYMTHLKTARNLVSKTGNGVKSKIIHVKERNIADHKWVDGMHLGSEVISYYTRYLATIKDRIAILVTFSAHKAHYTKYSGDFNRAIQSLRVVASKDLLGNRDRVNLRPGDETIGAPIGSHMPSDFLSDLPDEGSGGLSKMQTRMIGLILLLLAIGGYLYIRKKRKKKK